MCIRDSVCAVHVVIDSDKTHALLREQHFRVKSHLQVITPQPAHVLDYCLLYTSADELTNEN